MANEIERLTDLVRYMRHELHDAGLISDDEFTKLVQDSDEGKRVARLEGYDLAIADLRRQLEEALKTSAGWKMCADKCNQEFALAAERDAAIKEAGFAEGIRKAEEAVKQRIGEGLSLPKSVGDKAYAKAGKHCEEAVLSLLPEPTEPSAGGAE